MSSGFKVTAVVRSATACGVAATALVTFVGVAVAASVDIPSIFMRRQPHYLQGHVESVCLVPHSGLPNTIVCGMGDGTLTTLVYQSGTKAFLTGKSYEPGDPILDMCCITTRSKTRLQDYVAALGAENIHLFSSDLKLVDERRLDGHDSRPLVNRSRARSTRQATSASPGIRIE